MDKDNSSQLRATIKDVAREAGVSLGTASRVLNGKASAIRISDETARRVTEAANKLSYRKNMFASGLRGEAASVVGIIVRGLEDPFMRNFLGVFQAAAHQRNIDVLIGNADYSSDTAGRQIRFMLEHWFSGLVLLGNLPENTELREAIGHGNTPCVAVDCNDYRFENSIGVDDDSGARQALDHLIELGHRHVAFIGDTALAGVDVRESVFKEYVSSGRLAPESKAIGVSNRAYSDLSAVHGLLRGNDRPTAVFCGSDNLALRVLAICKSLALEVPKDLSVIGFDDIPESAAAHPALTTVAQPLGEMAGAALTMLAHLTQSSPSAASSSLFAPSLVVRGSTARPS